ncbi:MAG: PHP domain-containing protein [Streptosporangiaceae bacterium]
MTIDLHAHSAASDGTHAPAEVVARAAAAGVEVLALTDHDTVAGWDEASAALPPGLSLVPGMELSCQHDGRSLHLLGYLFDPAEAELSAELDRIRAARADRAEASVVRLRQLGADVTMDLVRGFAGDGEIGRPHLADALIAVGAVADRAVAFSDRWLAQGGRAHVTRYAADPVRAVRLINGAGGAAVLAHPRALGRRGYSFDDDLIEELAAAGLAGIEADHPDHAGPDRVRLRALAAALGLAVTGSSDDHGDRTGNRLGCESTTEADLRKLLDQTGGSMRTAER